MSFAGDYRLTHMMGMKADESGFEYVDIDTMIEKADDPHEKSELTKMKNSIIRVAEDGHQECMMKIPEDTPQEDIDEAIADGMKVIDGWLVFEEQDGKVEDGKLYMYDRSKALNGTEWVQISTDEDGILDTGISKYARV